MIKCVMFCEFDVNFGPILTYQYPNYMSNEVFGTLSDFLIPLPELCGKLITAHINNEDFVVGQPIIIFNEKYDRRKLEFNLAFILPHEEYQKLPIYENFIRKIAMHLTMLETFEGFLYDLTRKSCLQQICQQIYTDILNGVPQCFLVFDDLNILTLDYDKKNLLTPPVINDYVVPVPLANLSTASSLSYDFTVQSVISAVDGKKCVKHIKNLVNLSENKVILCLQHLYYQGLIDFIDLFQVSNVYRVTGKVSAILTDLALESVNYLGKASNVTKFEIFDYYTELSDKIISDFLEENPVFLTRFDIELFIAYGVLKGILKRIHRYCVAREARQPWHSQDTEFLKKLAEMKNKNMLNGNTSMDEICIHFFTEQRTIESKLKDLGCIFSK